MEHVFGDTSFWVARFNAGDANHRKAEAFLRALQEPGSEPVRFVITDHVFDETVTVLRFQSGRHDVAAAAGRVLRGSEGVRLVPVGPPAFEEAWTLFLERPDKRWSFTDCTSFVVMEDLDVRKAASFDRNFVEAGFAVLP